MSNTKSSSDKERIAELEKEILEIKKLLLESVNRIEMIIGIDQDYTHKPVSRIKP